MGMGTTPPLDIDWPDRLREAAGTALGPVLALGNDVFERIPRLDLEVLPWVLWGGDSLAPAPAPIRERAVEFAAKYAPLLPIVILLWPFVLTLILAILSAAAWMFWLLTYVIVGFVQLIYIGYNVGLITIDLAILGLLKTFAMIRSQVRYFTVKSGLVLGKEQRGRTRRRGRTRQWRNKLDRATFYGDFLDIDVEEPYEAVQAPGRGRARRGIGGGSGAPRPPVRPQQLLNRVATSIKQRMASNASDTAVRGKPRSNPNGRPPIGPRSPKSSVRKSKSCVDLESRRNLTRTGGQYLGGDGRGGGSISGASIVRVKSTASMSARLENADEGSEGSDPRTDAVEAELGMTGGMLLATTARLREARQQVSSRSPPQNGGDGESDCGSSSSSSSSSSSGGSGGGSDEDGKDSTLEEDNESSLKFLLAGVVKRNHLSVDDILIEDARSVAESGRHRLSQPARETIRNYNEEVERCLDWVAEAPIKNISLASSRSKRTLSPGGEVADDVSTVMERQGQELLDRIHLLRNLKQNTGRTALMLSGGGAQAMYHLGTIRALVDADLYDEIKVISGTSGGSISAAMCAIRTSEELYRDVCVETVSTDYLLTGEMKRKNIRWFPKAIDMLSYWLKTRLMVDSADFKRCCDFYFEDITFEEAFKRTGKHVCITVSASRATTAGSGQRLLLNHISTPHVTIASAVAASCALPGVMKPAKLLTKDNHGKQAPFEVDGVEWIDGSVQADLPFKRISTLFNVNNFVVAQTNFHVLPFLNKAHHPSKKSLYWRTFQTCEWDIRNRVLNLGRLGLFPRFFGQDISKVFKQKYHGNLTLVPRFTTRQVFGLQALVNPSVEDMKVYLKNGQMAAWPYLTVIKDMIRLECKIDRCIAHLEERYHALAPDYDAVRRWNDDADSVSVSSTVSVANRLRYASAGRETELLRQKVHILERDNVSLRQQIQQLQRALGIIHPLAGDMGEKMDVSLPPPVVGGLVSFELSEDDEKEELDANTDGEEKKQ